MAKRCYYSSVKPKTLSKLTGSICYGLVEGRSRFRLTQLGEEYDIINLVGDVLFQATCIGQLNVFCVLVKDDDGFGRKIRHLESLIKSVRVLISEGSFGRCG